MPQVDLVVIGASAGGLAALIEIVERLPRDLGSAIVIAVHNNAERDSYLPQILGRRTLVPVSFAAHDEAMVPGHVYVAPPDYHVLVARDRLRLGHGPRENGFRPAIDPLFRSAARAYGPRVMGVILSGALDDGSYGLRVIRDSGGITVVQDPADADVPAMPLNALRVVDADYVLAAAQIAELVAGGVVTSGGGQSIMSPKQEPDPQLDETEVAEMEDTFGPPSGLTCPDCGGALWEITNGSLVRYRCHVGHQFTSDSLDAEQQDVVEGALWAAVRVLEEHAALRQRMASRAESAGMSTVSAGFTESAHDSQQQAHTIRGLLFGRAAPPAAAAPPPKASRRSPNGRGAKANGKGRRPRRAR